MTTVGQVNQELKVVAQQNEGTQVQGSNVDAQLREAFSSDQPQGNQLTKPLKAQDLNFEGFPKGNRLDASEFAGRSLNEVKDAAREFNADFPETPYVVDYSEFPKPEAFSKKNYGGKEEAYNAWKDAVTEWVEDCKQDMVTRKSNHIGSMTEKFERAMNNGFFNIYLQMGMTRDFIQATYEALKGDINKVKEQLDAKAEEIKKHSSAVGRNVTRNVNANTNRQVGGLHEHLDYNTSGLHAHIDDAESGLHNHIDDAVDKINTNTDQRAQETQDVVTAESQKIQKQEQASRQIGALSDAISSALHGNTTGVNINVGGFGSTGSHTEETCVRAENLKNEIIASTKIDDNKKIELLTKLRDLVTTDDWITRGNLEAIVTEARRII